MLKQHLHKHLEKIRTIKLKRHHYVLWGFWIAAIIVLTSIFWFQDIGTHAAENQMNPPECTIVNSHTTIYSWGRWSATITCSGVNGQQPTVLTWQHFLYSWEIISIQSGIPTPNSLKEDEEGWNTNDRWNDTIEYVIRYKWLKTWYSELILKDNVVRYNSVGNIATSGSDITVIEQNTTDQYCSINVNAPEIFVWSSATGMVTCSWVNSNLSTWNLTYDSGTIEITKRWTWNEIEFMQWQNERWTKEYSITFTYKWMWSGQTTISITWNDATTLWISGTETDKITVIEPFCTEITVSNTSLKVNETWSASFWCYDISGSITWENLDYSGNVLSILNWEETSINNDTIIIEKSSLIKWDGDGEWEQEDQTKWSEIWKKYTFIYQWIWAWTTKFQINEQTSDKLSINQVQSKNITVSESPSCRFTLGKTWLTVWETWNWSIICENYTETIFESYVSVWDETKIKIISRDPWDIKSNSSASFIYRGESWWNTTIYINDTWKKAIWLTKDVESDTIYVNTSDNISCNIIISKTWITINESWTATISCEGLTQSPMPPNNTAIVYNTTIIALSNTSVCERSDTKYNCTFTYTWISEWTSEFKLKANSILWNTGIVTWDNITVSSNEVNIRYIWQEDPTNINVWETWQIKLACSGTITWFSNLNDLWNIIQLSSWGIIETWNINYWALLHQQNPNYTDPVFYITFTWNSSWSTTIDIIEGGNLTIDWIKYNFKNKIKTWWTIIVTADDEYTVEKPQCEIEINPTIIPRAYTWSITVTCSWTNRWVLTTTGLDYSGSIISINNINQATTTNKTIYSMTFTWERVWYTNFGIKTWAISYSSVSNNYISWDWINVIDSDTLTCDWETPNPNILRINDTWSIWLDCHLTAMSIQDAIKINSAITSSNPNVLNYQTGSNFNVNYTWNQTWATQFILTSIPLNNYVTLAQWTSDNIEVYTDIFGWCTRWEPTNNPIWIWVPAYIDLTCPGRQLHADDINRIRSIMNYSGRLDSIITWNLDIPDSEYPKTIRFYYTWREVWAIQLQLSGNAQWYLYGQTNWSPEIKVINNDDNRPKCTITGTEMVTVWQTWTITVSCENSYWILTTGLREWDLDYSGNIIIVSNSSDTITWTGNEKTFTFTFTWNTAWISNLWLKTWAIKNVPWIENEYTSGNNIAVLDGSNGIFTCQWHAPTPTLINVNWTWIMELDCGILNSINIVNRLSQFLISSWNAVTWSIGAWAPYFHLSYTWVRGWETQFAISGTIGNVLIQTDPYRSSGIKVDNSAATCSITLEPNSWTSGSVTLTLTPDWMSQYSWTGFDNMTTTNTPKIVTQNWTYTWYVKNNVGTTWYCTATVTGIDTDVPTVGMTNSGTDWKTGDISIRLTASDATSWLSGNAKYYWTWVTTATLEQCWASWTTYTSGTTITGSTEWIRYLYVCAYDKAGNSKVASGTYKLDKTDPECGTWTYNPLLTEWTSGNVTATLTWSTDGISWILTWGWSCTISTYNGTCNVTISDNAWNTKTCTSSGATNIDTAWPTWDIIINYPSWNLTNWCTSGNVVLTLSWSDNNGLPDSPYKRNDWEWTWNNDLVLNWNGSWTWYIRDVAWNTIQIPYNITWISHSWPSISLNNPFSWAILPWDVNFVWNATFDDNECQAISWWYNIVVYSWTDEIYTWNTENTNIETTLPDWTYTWKVDATDILWHTSESETWTLLINSQAPTCDIEYTPASWQRTSGSVEAILTWCSEWATWFNETGHIFDENWAFTFEFTNNLGISGNAHANVRWIDKTPPYLSWQTQTTTWWYTWDLQYSFIYDDTWAGISWTNTISCIIDTEWTWQTCSITDVNICDNAWNCNIKPVVSQGINLDTSNPICGDWSYNPWSGALTSWDVEVVLSWSYDTISQINISTWSCTITWNDQNCSLTISDNAWNTKICTSENITWIDKAAPILAEVTPIWTTTDTTPDYTFSSTKSGTITYSGACSSSTTWAVSGNNTITLNTLPVWTYSGCTITVTDEAWNTSEVLTISTFTIQWWGGGGGWWSLKKDYCPDGDYSDSYYDWTCEWDDEIIDICNVMESNFDTEMKTAYLYAYIHGMTTICPIDDANMYWVIRRDELAKMLSQYAINVLDLEPQAGKSGCTAYNDIANSSAEMKYYMKTACELNIMWLESDWKTPMKSFYPHWLVTRAEFWTTLSRLIYGDAYNLQSEAENTYPWAWYGKHLEALKRDEIMTQIYGDRPQHFELRWYVMLMLMRHGKARLDNVKDSPESTTQEILEIYEKNKALTCEISYYESDDDYGSWMIYVKDNKLRENLKIHDEGNVSSLIKNNKLYIRGDAIWTGMWMVADAESTALEELEALLDDDAYSFKNCNEAVKNINAFEIPSNIRFKSIGDWFTELANSFSSIFE